MLVIAWRELLGESEVESFIHLTKLADAPSVVPATGSTPNSAASWAPHGRRWQPQPLLILGMGKLGGGELNFSRTSTYLHLPGERLHRWRSAARQPAVLHQAGAASHQRPPPAHPGWSGVPGRHAAAPFGDAGPLAISFAAMEDYYQHHGRNWERYAMVKARVLGPSANTPRP